MNVNNLTNVYNQNPTLQGQYTLQQYLDLYGSTSATPTTTATPAATPTPVQSGQSQGIINSGINQFQGGGGGIQTLDPYSRPQGKPLDPNSFLGKTIQGARNIGGSLVDKFSGLPGVDKGKSLINNIMDNTMVGRLAAMRNPLNPKASNYSRNLQGQIDMLEGTTGTRVFGTSDNLQFEDAAMIGRDPNSGLGKYGPGSVLSGQNVVSGFGTNDYVGQLQNYIDKMMSYKTRSKFQQAKLDRAIAEKKAATQKAEAEMKAKEKAQADRARAANASVYASADKQGFTRGGGGFASHNTGTNDAFGNKSGRGRTGYDYGGRVGAKDGGSMIEIVKDRLMKKNPAMWGVGYEGLASLQDLIMSMPFNRGGIVNIRKR
jgi:hypothetical protein